MYINIPELEIKHTNKTLRNQILVYPDQYLY